MRADNDLICEIWEYQYTKATRFAKSVSDFVRGTNWKQPSNRVLVVEDYEPFRRFISSTVGGRPEFQIVGEITDGLEAVQKAEELQPDLIILDIGFLR